MKVKRLYFNSLLLCTTYSPKIYLMNILLPTDFSNRSIISIYYAAKIARKMNAEIILLYVAPMDTGAGATSSLKAGQLLDLSSKNALEDLQIMAHKLKQDVGSDLKVRCEVVQGFSLEQAVGKFSAENQIDFIVMGTKGASGLKKILLGSNTTAVIASSNIPVIAVPEFAYFDNIHQILYASDLQDVEQEVKALQPFAQLFHASIHLLHIVAPGSEEASRVETLKESLSKQYGHLDITIQVSVHDNVPDAIEATLKESGARMLAMFTHKPTFFEKLFGKSMTREMAFHDNVSLLSFKKSGLG